MESKMNKKMTYLTATGLTLALTACGGGGGGSKQTSLLSGRVLDGAVSNARVCFDVNGDNQCTSIDNYVTTDSEGNFEISYQGSSPANQLIADIRHSESTDPDYLAGNADYDYVLQAFEQSSTQNNVISPLTTYMSYQQRATGEDPEVIAEELVQTISQYENYSYSTGVEVEYNYSEYVQGDFIANMQSSDQHEADYNKRLHNINEVLARQLQESQAVWEDRFYSGDLSNEVYEWSEISELVVTNSNSTVFQGFEFLVDEVTQNPFVDFDSLEVSDNLWVNVPPADQINNLLDYVEVKKNSSAEFEGNTYRSTVTTDGEITAYSYYTISSNGTVTSNLHFLPNSIYPNGSCVNLDSDFELNLASAGISETDWINSINEGLSSNQTGSFQVFSNYVRTNELPPIACSSFADFLANLEVATSLEDIEDAEDGTIADPVPRGFSDAPCGACGPIKPIGAIVSTSSPTTKHTASLSNGGSGSPPGGLATCSYGGVKYAQNPCKSPSNKN